MKIYSIAPKTSKGKVLVSQSCPTLCDPTDCSCQAPLSMGFPRQENQSGLPFPSPRDLPNPGIKPTSSALAGRFFIAEPPGKLDLCKNKSTGRVMEKVLERPEPQWEASQPAPTSTGRPAALGEVYLQPTGMSPSTFKASPLLM